MRGKVTVGAAIILLCLCAHALAQNVVTGGTNWGAATPPPPSPGPGLSSGNTFGFTSGGFYSGAAPTGRGLTLLGYEGTAMEDGAGATDSFRLRIIQQRSFVLGESAIVAIPLFLNGSITFAGPPFGPPPSNFAFGDATGTAEIYDAAGTTVLTVSRHTAAFNPTGPLPAFDSFDYAQTPTPLAAGTYRIRTIMEIAGEGGSSSSLPGAQVTVDFYDGGGANQRRGAAASVGAFKDGLANSRVAVTAVSARANFGVDGAFVTVGLLEPGLPYTTHTSLPAARLTNTPGGISPGSDWTDEHALATAGIIAADDPNTDKAGMAPKAKIIAVNDPSYGVGLAGTAGALAALAGKVQVISQSAGTPQGGAQPYAEQLQINQFVNANPRITFVQSAGNNEPMATDSVGREAKSENAVVVGALNRDFTFRASFSSFTHGIVAIKPDIVAPGEYITAPQTRDTNGDTAVNDFGKIFLGDDFSHAGGPTVGAISGTSFSTPLVAGAAALMNDYQKRHTDFLDANSVDHRVIKAILLNSAKTNIKHGDNVTPWQQVFSTGTHILVSQSLDSELGAGMLDTNAALGTFSAGEVRSADDNSARNFGINAAGGIGLGVPFWDFENVGAKSDGVNGTVDYLLGAIIGEHLRATLTWDVVVNGAGTAQTFDQLELRLYQEGSDALNLVGFDPVNPAADNLLAETGRAGENVKLLDLIPTSTSSKGLYLQVTNFSGTDTFYGIAVQVPEPASLLILMIMGACLGRPRRL